MDKLDLLALPSAGEAVSQPHKTGGLQDPTCEELSSSINPLSPKSLGGRIVTPLSDEGGKVSEVAKQLDVEAKQSGGSHCFDVVVKASLDAKQLQMEADGTKAAKDLGTEEEGPHKAAKNKEKRVSFSPIRKEVVFGREGMKEKKSPVENAKVKGRRSSLKQTPLTIELVEKIGEDDLSPLLLSQTFDREFWSLFSKKAQSLGLKKEPCKQVCISVMRVFYDYQSDLIQRRERSFSKEEFLRQIKALKMDDLTMEAALFAAEKVCEKGLTNQIERYLKVLTPEFRTIPTFHREPYVTRFVQNTLKKLSYALGY